MKDNTSTTEVVTVVEVTTEQFNKIVAAFNDDATPLYETDKEPLRERVEEDIHRLFVHKNVGFLEVNEKQHE